MGINKNDLKRRVFKTFYVYEKLSRIEIFTNSNETLILIMGEIEGGKHGLEVYNFDNKTSRPDEV
jgi:hypothetical protein